MERFLWIASHFSARFLFILLCVGIGFLIYVLPNDIVFDVIKSHKTLWVTLGIITLVFAIPLGIIGGKAGYKYVEMGRSRHWKYRSTAYSRSDDRLRNTLYWAIEFALYPANVSIIIAIIICFKLFVPSANL
jgi:hypothetical protein